MVQEARPTKRPRAGADETSQNPQMSKAGRIASFEFELDTYCVNGYATQAKERVAASRARPNRHPTSASPISARLSNRSALKWAAGRSSHLPLQP